MIRALVVDDERLARVGLTRQLAALGGVEVVAEAGDGESAVAAIAAHRPDVVFLDVQMPGGDGFDVIARVDPATMPAVVFVTAFDEFAVEAFEAEAADYLLKPVDPARLAQAVDRVKRRLASRTAESGAAQVAALLDRVGRGRRVERIPVPDRGAFVFLSVPEITRAESDANYVTLQWRGKPYRLRATLDAMRQRLGDRFVQVSRSALVNRDLIDRVEYFVQGRYVITLRDGTRVESSRSFRDRVAALIHE